MLRAPHLARPHVSWPGRLEFLCNTWRCGCRYAEAATGDEAVALAAEVCQLVFDRCEGIPPPPASAQFVDEIDATTVHSLSVLEKVVSTRPASSRAVGDFCVST